MTEFRPLGPNPSFPSSKIHCLGRATLDDKGLLRLVHTTVALENTKILACTNPRRFAKDNVWAVNITYEFEGQNLEHILAFQGAYLANFCKIDRVAIRGCEVVVRFVDPELEIREGDTGMEVFMSKLRKR